MERSMDRLMSHHFLAAILIHPQATSFDQRDLFVNELCCNSIIHPSIDQKKILNLTWFLWFWYVSNRKRPILNSRAKRLHTPGETASDSERINSGSGRNDYGRTGNRAKRPASLSGSCEKSPEIKSGLRWLHRIIIYGAACANAVSRLYSFWCWSMRSLFHLAVGDLGVRSHVHVVLFQLSYQDNWDQAGHFLHF